MRLRRLLLAAAAASLMVFAARAQQVTWSTGFVNAVGSSYVDTLKTVPARIDAATKGRLKIELYDTLVAGPEQPAAVRDGRLDASFAVSPWLSAEAPYVNFGHLPGLLTDVAQYQKMLDPLLREEMAKVWKSKYKRCNWRRECSRSSASSRAPRRCARLQTFPARKYVFTTPKRRRS
jgi:TRAP-type C4-dicarboxylate transport system substrate-binding protein